jgi:hypothetical protein
MGLIMVGLTVAQFLLVGGYLALVERGTKRSELVGSLLAVLLVTMWWGILVANNVTVYAVD